MQLFELAVFEYYRTHICNKGEEEARSGQSELIDYSETAQCLFGLRSNQKLQATNKILDLSQPTITVATIKGTPKSNGSSNCSHQLITSHTKAQ